MCRTLITATLFILSILPAQAWEPTPGPMLEEYRQGHTATVLQDGKVLVAGGGKTPNESSVIEPLNTCEIFDSATGIWHLAAEMNNARRSHSAIRLQSGEVVVMGGLGVGGELIRETEIYHPSSNTWQSAGEMTNGRYGHTSTLLPSGVILVVGGYDAGGDPLDSVEIFQPGPDGGGVWQTAASLQMARADHTATTLTDGGVLVTGGIQLNGAPTDHTEVYRGGFWQESAAPDLLVRVSNHTVTRLHSGKILLSGGLDSNGQAVSRAFLYDPTAFAADGSGWSSLPDIPNAHQAHSAALLPSGRVLLGLGQDSDQAAVWDPVAETWTGLNATERVRATLTLLPTGGVLVAGGVDEDTSEVLNPELGVLHDHDVPSDASTGPAVLLLPDGRPVRIGAKTEVFRIDTKDWVDFGFDPPSVDRTGATATLLHTGKVLVVGGDSAAAELSAEILNPVDGTWSDAPGLTYERSGHTATLLATGEVLVVGGDDHDIAEIYDPADGTWFQTSAMSAETKFHAATLLNDGRVLITGGTQGTVAGTKDLEIYDPNLDQWELLASRLRYLKSHHAAMLLSSGKVIIWGGSQYSSSAGHRLKTTEIFDPMDGSLTELATMKDQDWKQAVGLLPNGQIFVAGRYTRELFDPVSETWRLVENNNLNFDGFHRGQLLQSGEVLIVQPGTRASRLYIPEYIENTEGSADLLGRRPVIQTLSQGASSGITRLLSFQELRIQGQGFHGGSEGHGGRSSGSDVDFPRVWLQSLENDRVYNLPTTYGSNPGELLADPRGLAIDLGHYFLYVSRGHIPSEARILQVGCDLAVLQQPEDQAALIGGTATFSVNIVGADEIQWYRDGVPISGAVTSTYTTGILSVADDQARFWVEANSELCGRVVSEPADLSVNDELPTLEVTSPAEGDLWYLSLPEAPVVERITWSATDDVRICKVVVQLRCSKDGGNSYGTDQCETGIDQTFESEGDCEAPGVTQGFWDVQLPTTYPSGVAGSLYKVRVRVTDSADQNNTEWSGSFRIEQPDVEQQFKTLILTHPQRMQDLLGFDEIQAQLLQTKLQELARHPRVAGLVIDLGESLAQAYQAWDDASTAADGVAKANDLLFGCSNGSTDCQDLQGLIHDALDDFPGIENVVLVGDDRIIPMARVLDFASLLPEGNYIQELAQGGRLRQALATNHFLSDDPLAVLDPVDLPDLTDLYTVFIPDLRMGRLVEQPEEIVISIDQFIARNGELDLTQRDPEAGAKVLVTGYDFLSDSAQNIGEIWTSALGTSDDPRFPVNHQLTESGWGVSAIQERRDEMLRALCGFGGDPYGIMSLSGHGTHFELGVPGQNRFDIQGVATGSLASADVCAAVGAGDGGLDLEGGLVYAVGCHAGLSVPDGPAEPHPLDLPQTMMGRGAGAFLANAGYGWGLLSTVGYSERLVELFTEGLVSADLPSPVGYWVSKAKLDYWLEQIAWDAYDRKTLMQWTLYGLPMYQVRTVHSGLANAGLRGDEDSLPSLADLPLEEHREGVTITRRPTSSGENAAGLPPYLTKVEHLFAFSEENYQKLDSTGAPVQNPDGSEVVGCPDPQNGEIPGCYYALNGEVVAEANRPILPRFTFQSGLSNLSQHGVLWTGGNYSQESSWTTLFGRLASNFPDESADPGNEIGAAPRLIFNRPTIPRHIPGQDPDDCRPSADELNHLVVSTGEVLEDPANPGEGFNLHRRYASMSLEVFYLNDTEPDSDRNCDRTGPALLEGFGDFFHQQEGNILRWAAEDTGDQWRVVVVYDDGTLSDEGEGAWRPLELTQGQADDGSPIWEAELSFEDPTLVTYFVQAVDRQGNVTWNEFEPEVVTGDGVELRVPLPVDVVIERGEADLGVEIVEFPAFVAVGAGVQYGLQVENLSAVSATGLQATLELPEGSVFRTGGGDGWSCEGEDNVVTCTKDLLGANVLGAGSSSRLDVLAEAPSDLGIVEAVARIESFDDDPVSENDWHAVQIEVIDGSDLWIQKEAGDELVVMPPEGEPVTVTYAILVGNDGPEAVHGATVTDEMPDELEAVTWECYSFLGASCTPSGEGDILDTTVVLPSGAWVLYTVTGELTDSTFEGQLVNTATVEGPEVARDPDGSNNISSISTEIVGVSNVIFTDGFESGGLESWSGSGSES